MRVTITAGLLAAFLCIDAGDARAESGLVSGASYWPAIVNAPQVEKDTPLEFAWHPTLLQQQLNAAAAVGPHLAVRAAGDVRLSFTGQGEHNSSVDVGLEWFERRGNWRHAIALDVGTGNVKNVRTNLKIAADDEDPQAEIRYDSRRWWTRYNRVGLQGASSIRRHGGSLTGVLRATHVNGQLRHEFKGSRLMNGSEVDYVETGKEDIAWFLLEPAAIGRVWLSPALSLEGQFGTSVPLGGVTRTQDEAGLWPFIATAGLVLKI